MTGLLRVALQKVGGTAELKSVQVKGGDSSWIDLTNTFGADWELPNVPSGPLQLHITDNTGKEVAQASFILIRICVVQGCGTGHSATLGCCLLLPSTPPATFRTLNRFPLKRCRPEPVAAAVVHR